MLTGLNISAQLRAATHVAWRLAVWGCACVGVLSVVGCRDTVLLSPIVITPPIDTSAALDTVRLSLPATTRIASGASASCELRVDGSVVCWGYWDGIGPTLPMQIPPTLDGRGNVVAFALIDLGARLCALSTSGEAYCQPYPPGSSGATSASTSGVLVRVVTRHRFRTLNSGYGTSCALTPSGQGFCWGDGASGSFGDGKFGEGHITSSPIALSTDLRFSALAAGGGNIQCAIVTIGSPYCWGSNHGSFGDIPLRAGDCTTSFWISFAGKPCAVPTPVDNAPPLHTVSSGYSAVCGVSDDGRAYCWGVGRAGELGNGVSSVTMSPVAVNGGLSFAELSMGAFHVCALTVDWHAYCWGNNLRGYLGIGDRSVGGSAVPVAVAGGLTFAALATGEFHACGITMANDIWCWGLGAQGQLGRDPSLGDAYAPVRVAIAVP